MAIATAALQVALSIGIPLLVLWLEGRFKVIRVLSPVVVCYALGMLLGNQPWLDFADPVALTTCNVTVALAIPLLLFSTNIVAWLKLAKSTVLSFFFCMIAVMISSAIAHLIFHDDLEQSAEVAGMLTGVYTGGTPNMAAIATALQVKSETFILLNAADMLVSFAYLFFILTLAGRLLSRLVPATPRTGDDTPDDKPGTVAGWPPLRSIGISLALTTAIVAIGLSVRPLLGDNSRDAVTILIITTGAVIASTFRRVRSLPGTQDMGQFLLLVFCVAMGFTTDFSKLFSSPSNLFGFTAMVIGGSVFIHFSLAILFRIDRDTIVITSAAAIFGPHMVGPVAVAIKNREVIFSGLASGLVGYAVGNYLGVGLAWLLNWL